MRTHQIECGEIADPLIQRRRALEVGEQEGLRRDLEPLIEVKIVGLEDVAEGLVRQHPFGGEERSAPAEQIVKRACRDEDGRQCPHAGLVVERNAQRARAQGDRPGRRVRFVVD